VTKTGKIERIVNRRSEILTVALEMSGRGPTSTSSLVNIQSDRHVILKE